MHSDLLKYIDENFPGFWNDIHVRFELGEPFENGTDERLNQVSYRVTTLFEEVFSKDDFIYLYIEDTEDDDIMFGNMTPNYLYDIISHHKFEETVKYRYDEDTDEQGNTIEVKDPYKVKILGGTVSSIPYKKILQGIANYEQGRKPKIGQRVYFINTNKDIIFNMYDDRGCIIYSNSKEKLINLYQRYNEWLVDYWREYFDNIFKEV